MSEPRRQIDPLALAVNGAAALLVVVAAGYLAHSFLSDPAPIRPVVDLDKLRASVEKLVEQKQAPPPKPAPSKPASAKPASAKPAPARAEAAAAAKTPAAASARFWSYRVTLEPPTWRDVVLDYRIVGMVSGTAVYTEFRHAQGKMNFQLGTFAPNHPSHANVRFPGFFMHAAYLPEPLVVGQRLAWQWPWQLSGGGVKEGRIKRYTGEVKAWEEVATPAGSFRAARIETILAYLEQGRAVASARETLWYSPQAMQVVKVVREGRTPDEGFDRIVAELAEFR